MNPFISRLPFGRSTWGRNWRDFHCTKCNSNTYVDTFEGSVQHRRAKFRAVQIKNEQKQTSASRTKRFPFSRIRQRASSIEPTDDWTTIWPAAAPFQATTVPLPLRMGVRRLNMPNPVKYANPELVKIPNFLHLTPKHVSKHCAVVKQFCTPWPAEMTDGDLNHYFPLNIVTTDYVFAGSSIRRPEARKVEIRLALDNLEFDDHSREKFLLLSGDRVCNNSLTLVSGRCPTRKQNTDYLHYLLTALYFESWTFEDWEKSMTHRDMVYGNHRWRKSPVVANQRALRKDAEEISETHGDAVDRVLNCPKDDCSKLVIKEYGDATRKLLGIA